MRPSLTRRLLTLYVATILIVVGIAATLVWVMMRRALHAGLDEALRAEAQALAGRLEAENGHVEFEQRTLDPDRWEPGDALVRIVDEGGRIIFSSSALTHAQSLMEPRGEVEPMESPFWLTVPLMSPEQSFRLVRLHADARPDHESAGDDRDSSAVGVWILVARSLAPVNQTLGQLASVLALAVGAAVLASLIGGFVVARRGTRPVRSLAEGMARVNAGDPELVLNRDEIPVELEPIARTTDTLLARVRAELTRQRQLTADVAHDLRTPVAGVRTLLDVCVQRERTCPEYVTAIEQARAALRQLTQLLDDVLTLSRLDAGVDWPVRAQVSLEDVLSAAVATVQPLAAARDVSIQTAPSPRTDLLTDRGKLAKILSNLLSNAVEHSPSGQVVHLTAQVADGSLELAVIDHGPGIPPDIRGRIFDRFVRGDAARSSGDGHHGLGLPIVAELARVLGGAVTLDQRYESGSRFIVRLPLQ